MILDNLLKNSVTINVDHNFRGMFVSDLHLGERDKADDFQPYSDRFYKVLMEVFDSGYTLFLLGDIWDLWEGHYEDIVEAYPKVNGLIEDFRKVGRLYSIAGNHDYELSYPQAYVLLYPDGKRVLICHGHQVDWINFAGWPIARGFVRYIWKTLQFLGFKDPSSARQSVNPKRHASVKLKLIDWAKSQKDVFFLGGHVHEFELQGNYMNCGCHGKTAIFAEGGQFRGVYLTRREQWKKEKA